MENEKLQINLGDGVTGAEVILREGAAAKVLDPKPPVKTNIEGTLHTVAEYLSKRVLTGQFTQERAHILVNREDVTLTLIINENDEYERGTIRGTLEENPAFVGFGINNYNKLWAPSELGLYVKMNRAFFADIAANRALVTELMNYKATVNNKVERSAKESGDRTDNFEQVVHSNLPKSFTLRIPIFKGYPAEVIEIETFAQVNGRDVAFILLSPAAKELLEDLRNTAIDTELEAIRGIAPDIAIIEQ